MAILRTSTDEPEAGGVRTRPATRTATVSTLGVSRTYTPPEEPILKPERIVPAPDVILTGGTNIVQDAAMSPLSNVATPYLERKIEAVAPSAKVTDYLSPDNRRQAVPDNGTVSTFIDAPEQTDAGEPPVQKNTALKIAAAAITGTAAGATITKVIDLFKEKREERQAAELKKVTTVTPEDKLKNLANLAGIAAAVFGLIMFLTKK